MNSATCLVSEALAALADGGFRLGLCTSKRVDFAGQILKFFGLRDYFAFVSGGEVGAHKDQQLRVLLADSVAPQHSTMIGDRAVDIHAAKANGLQSVGVLRGHGSGEELLATGPDRLLRSVEELAQFRSAG